MIGTHRRPSISVVIPNLDGAHWLEGCLDSLSECSSAVHEIIVADDGSTDGSRDVCARFGACFVESPRARTGFAATANRGIRTASGDAIFLLNNDTTVAPSSIRVLSEMLERHPDVAMLAPLVLSLRDRATIDSAGMLIFPDATARPRWHGNNIATVTLRDEAVLVPSGAAAVFRREWLDRVGLLDEAMTSYLEDIDLGLRMRRAGGKALFVPEAVVYHYFSGTTGALSPSKGRFIERNHITVAARHLPLLWLLALPVTTAARWVVLVNTVLRAQGAEDGEPGPPIRQTATAVLRGLAEGIARLPRSLRERRSLARTATVTRAEWASLLRANRARVSDYRRFGA